MGQHVLQWARDQALPWYLCFAGALQRGVLAHGRAVLVGSGLCPSGPRPTARVSQARSHFGFTQA